MFTSSVRSGAVMMAVIVGSMFAGQAFAADAGSNSPATVAAAAPKVEHFNATGTIVTAHEMKANKQTEVYNLRIKEAKDTLGKALSQWNGKSLAITGAKLDDAKKLQGKQVEVTGISRDGKTIEVTAIHEMPMAPKPAAATPPAAAPAK